MRIGPLKPDALGAMRPRLTGRETLHGDPENPVECS